MVRSAHRVVIGVAVIALMVGCSPAGRGSAPQPAEITLTSAVPIRSKHQLQPFVDAVTRLSDGSIHIAFQANVRKGEDYRGFAARRRRRRHL